jgi:nitrate reductase NapD
MTTHISSLLITAKPETLSTVAEMVARQPFAEVAATDPSGKIIVTLETKSEGQIVETLDVIQVLAGVVNVSLVYHQVDDSLNSPPSSGANFGNQNG